MTAPLRAPRCAPAGRSTPRPVHTPSHRPSRNQGRTYSNAAVKLDCRECWRTVAERIDGLEGNCRCKVDPIPLKDAKSPKIPIEIVHEPMTKQMNAHKIIVTRNPEAAKPYWPSASPTGC